MGTVESEAGFPVKGATEGQEYPNLFRPKLPLYQPDTVSDPPESILSVSRVTMTQR